MSTTLAELTSSTPDAYFSKLRAFIITLEVLVNTMTMLMFSDESSFGPVERALVLSHLESARNSAPTIALFRQASALLGGLTTEQNMTLAGLMRTLTELEEEFEQPTEELEIISSKW